MQNDFVLIVATESTGPSMYLISTTKPFLQSFPPKHNLFTLYNTIPTLNHPERDLLKTLWENEKMLVTSIFSYSHDILTLPKANYSFCVKF